MDSKNIDGGESLFPTTSTYECEAASELNWSGGGDGSIHDTSSSVELSPSRAILPQTSRMRTHGDPCPNCRRPTIVVGSSGDGVANTVCNTRSCPAYKKSHMGDSATNAAILTDLKTQQQQQQQQQMNDRVANDQDSSDESPLLSSASNSGQGSSPDLSLNGDESAAVHRQNSNSNNNSYKRGDEAEEEEEEEHCHSQAAFSRMVARELRNQTVKNRLLGAFILTTLFATGEYLAGWYITYYMKTVKIQ